MYCQVAYICGCIPARIRHALADLPETLDETYMRTLREINKAHWEFAHRLFQFVAVASRPLRVEELAELLAFDFKAEPIPKFHEGWRLEDPADAVLSTCSSLLSIVNVEGSQVIQFSHFSVKELLTSIRLAEASDAISRRYHISMTPAHTLAAQACLGILLHLNKDVTSAILEELPLTKYAAEHWADHAQFEDVSRNVEVGMKQLFDPNEPHLAVCVWIHEPDVLTREQTPRTDRPLPPNGTPLHYAALWGLHSMVEFLALEHSQDVHSRGFTDNVTPLHPASKKGHVKVTRFLIERGADVTARDKHGSTPLHLASREGQLEVACMLIGRGVSVTVQNEHGWTPLHLASRWGHLEVVCMLIKHDTDVIVAQDKDGWTPLHVASRWGHLDVARTLIERGADVTAKNNDGLTPLHVASQEGQVEVIRILIERDVDVTTHDAGGETLLHLASRRGQFEVALMLIERDADLTAQDQDGSTPLHLAAREGHQEVTHVLIERGADLTAQNKHGLTPLHLASRQGQVEVARIFIERGADVAAQEKHGLTPLHLASREGQMDVVRMLIEAGVSVTARDKHGSTSLHLASLWGKLDVARKLIEHGADATAQNKDGLTPFHLASQWGGLAEV